MRFDIITIFPKIFDSYLKESLINRAIKNKIIDIRAHDLRDFAEARPVKDRRDPRRTVDDRPFGGGPGMVIKIEPVYKAVGSILKIFNSQFSIFKHKNSRVILFSTRGKKLDTKTAKRLSKYKQLILICGRYEGVDERVAKYVADEEISIGDYVLSGGELPAMVLIEAVSRFLPGFLGKYESLEEIKGSYPVYTRPEIFVPSAKRRRVIASDLPAGGGRGNLKNSTRSLRPRLAMTKNGWRVPKILLSGDHKKIAAWREKREE